MDHFFQELNNSVDIYLLQEHWLFDCQLNLLNEIHQQYTAVGKAVNSNDPITPLRMPSGYGGTAILWRKEICYNSNSTDNRQQSYTMHRDHRRPKSINHLCLSSLQRFSQQSRWIPGMYRSDTWTNVNLRANTRNDHWRGL